MASRPLRRPLHGLRSGHRPQALPAAPAETGGKAPDGGPAENPAAVPTEKQKKQAIGGDLVLPSNTFARGCRATANMNLLERTRVMAMQKMLCLPCKIKSPGRRRRDRREMISSL